MLAEPNQSKSFFYTCATVVEADSRIDPPANIVEENVNSDSEARPRGVFFWTIQSLLTVEQKERKRERKTEKEEQRIRGPKRARIYCRYWPRFVRLSIVLATVAEHIASERQKACQQSLLLPLHFFLLFFIPCNVSERIANQ